MQTATAVIREKYEQFKYDLETARQHIKACEEKLKQAREAERRVERLIAEFDTALTALENQGK